jgi:hypothetical protein
MATLNFPTNPSVGDQYSIGNNTWVWNGYAWVKFASSTQTPVFINTGTASTSTNTGAIVVEGGIGLSGSINAGTTSTVAGAEIITTATWQNFINLQTVTDSGNSTTNIIHILNTTSSAGTGTGALIIDGGISVGERVFCESIQIADAVMDSTYVEVNTTATVVVDTYSINDFRSSKYLIQIDEGGGPTADFEVIEILLLVDNQQTIYATEYAIIKSNGEMGEFAAEVDAYDMVNLYFTPFFATNKVLKVLRTAMSA